MPEKSIPEVKQPHVVFDDVSFRYPMSHKYALKHVSLTIFRGEFVAVLGENGAGKSTFCQCLNGVVPHSYGRRLYGKILVDGVDTQTASVAQLAQKVGIVLEDPETQLFTTSVLNEVAFGPENLGVGREEILDRVAWALRIVGLAGFEKTPPGALSGGQKQRLAIAAALTMRPHVLVLDEATSQLDPMGVRQVFSVARDLNKQYNMTIVMATDRGEEVAQYCDRVFVFHQGELIAQDAPREIFADETVLGRARIAIPQVSQLATYLGNQGIPLAGFPITLEEAKSEIFNLFGGTF